MQLQVVVAMASERAVTHDIFQRGQSLASQLQRTISAFFEPWHFCVFIPLSIITIWWGIFIGYYDAAIIDLIIKAVFACVIIREYRHRSDAMAYMRATTARFLLFVSMPVMWQCINPYSENVCWALLAIGALALEACLIIYFETGHWEKRLSNWTTRKKIVLNSGLALINTIGLGFLFGRLLAWTLNLHWHEKETGVRFKTEFSIAGADEGKCIDRGV